MYFGFPVPVFPICSHVLQLQILDHIAFSGGLLSDGPTVGHQMTPLYKEEC